MTIQQAFDKIWKHFIVDKNPPGYREGYGCVYRGDGGCRCAVGCLIPDEYYVSEMDEEWTLRGVLQNLSDRGWHELGGELMHRFLLDAQSAHDKYAGVDEFYQRLKPLLVKLASDYGLQVPA